MTLLLQPLLLLRVLYRPYYHYATYYHDEHCSYYLSLRVLGGVDSWLLELLNGRLSVHGRSVDDSPMVALYWLHGPQNGRLILLSP